MSNICSSDGFPELLVVFMNLVHVLTEESSFLAVRCYSSAVEVSSAQSRVQVEEICERKTSKAGALCGEKAHSSPVERGLYDCDSCGVVADTDVSSTENNRYEPSWRMADLTCK